MTDFVNAPILVFSNIQLSAEQPDRTDALVEPTLENLRSFHKFGGVLRMIAVLGNAVSEPKEADFAEVDRLLDAVMAECLEHSELSDFPPVVAVPGLCEREVVPGTRGAVDAVTHGWERTRKGLWAGEYDDVVQGVRRTYATFNAWAAKYSLESSGLLPGDGSIRFDVGGRRIGFISVNTTFRWSGKAELDSSPPAVDLEQLEAALPSGTLDEWGEELDLAVLFASDAAPVLCRPKLPLLGIAGGSSGVSRGASAAEIMWLAPTEGGKSASELVRIVFEENQRPKARIRLGRAASARVAPSVVKTTSPADAKASVAPRTAVFDEKQFDEALGSGKLVLLVVSGLQNEFINARGIPLIGPDDLARLLLSDLGQGHLSRVPPLGDVLRRSQKERSATCGAILTGALAAADVNGAATAKTMLSAPWARVYDFTGSNSLLMVCGDLDQPDASRINFVNAHQVPPSSDSSQMDLVAMNGVVDLDDAPVTFVPPTEFALDMRGHWFKQLEADLLLYPAMIVADDASSSALSAVLDILDRADDGQNSEFPRFLVAPHGEDVDEWRLAGLGIEHVRSEVGPAVRRLLAADREPVSQGNKVLAQLRREEKTGTGVRLVRKLVEQAGPGTENFVRGHEPTWGDIKSKKSAARLHHVDMIIEKANSGDTRPIVVVKGTAGSGKTAALMQYAIELFNKGKVVGWVDRSATRRMSEIEAEAAELELEAVFVDAVEIFGQKSLDVLRRLNRRGKVLVVASIRTTRMDLFPVDAHGDWVSQDDPLKDGDLKGLVKVLKNNSALGQLAKIPSLPPWLRTNKLREICDRNLLAAMVQVVTGEKLEDRVRSEYVELNSMEQIIYAVISLFVYSYEESSMRKDDLIQAVAKGGHSMRNAVDSIRDLVDMKILVESGLRLRCRHRMVSDLLINYLMTRPKRLAEAWEMLLVYYAAKAWNITDSNHPDRRNMVRFLSHSLPGKLGLPEEVTYNVYVQVRELLQHDFHYWLQRASYEIEKRNLGEAANYLHAAQGCEGGSSDFKVMTAFGTVVFRQAIESPADPKIGDQVLEIYDKLWVIIRVKRGSSPHTYVTLIREGYEWLKVSRTISNEKKRDIRDSLLEAVELASQDCSGNPQCMDVVIKYRPKLENFSGIVSGVPL
jgi:hypothetical protein